MSKHGLLILLAAVACSASIRLRHLDMPLERDEGEYAVMGRMILEGALPYRDAYNMKLPGVYVAYALIMAIFGSSAVGIHVGLLLVNAATIVVVFFFARKLFDEMAGWIAAGTYSVLSTSVTVLGLMAHATHFVILPAVAGWWVLLIAMERGRRPWFALSGALLGTAFLMKQPGIFFSLAALACLGRADWKKYAALSAGIVAPFALTCLAMAALGIFGRFWFWTVEYAWHYGTMVPLSEAWQLFWLRFPAVVGPFLLVWLIAAAGWIRTQSEPRRYALNLFYAASAAAVLPGLFFRPHYFIVLLPALAIGAAVAVRWLHGRRPWAPVGAYAGILLISAVLHLDLWLLTPTRLCHELYFPNPFVESVPLAKVLKETTQPSDRIAILGSEPQILFYAERRSAHGYLYAFPFMEEQKFAIAMQEEAIREIEASRPPVLVYVNVTTSWGRRPGSDLRILNWVESTVAEHYVRVGVVDLISDRDVREVWGPAAASYRPVSKNFISIHRRK